MHNVIDKCSLNLSASRNICAHYLVNYESQNGDIIVKQNFKD